MPNIKDILDNIRKDWFWAKIDMTNIIFQTHVHSDNIELTAINTSIEIFK